MNFAAAPLPDTIADAERLRTELARENRAAGGLGPVLRHLVASDENALLGEEPVARTRGLIEALALELLRAIGDIASEQHARAAIDALLDLPVLLAHCHVLALEGQACERLGERGIDPLLPPLVLARIGSADASVAGLAMNLMAAQTRFIRRQQRMQLVAAELPGDLLHAALDVVGAIAGREADAPFAALRADYDERRSRLALLAQLGFGLGDAFGAALDPAQAGLSLFATAISLVTGLERDAVILAAADGQQMRLALVLAMAGLAPVQREAALLCLHPDFAPPPHWFAIDSGLAAELLGRGHAA